MAATPEEKDRMILLSKRLAEQVAEEGLNAVIFVYKDGSQAAVMCDDSPKSLATALLAFKLVVDEVLGRMGIDGEKSRVGLSNMDVSLQKRERKKPRGDLS